MPLARIVTRAVEESQELAADLRSRGYEVEIVSPSDRPNTRADLELRLEECTPEEALIRAGVLPETNDMAVFIAPGAIANRRTRARVPTTPRFPTQSKWYDPLANIAAAPDQVLPIETHALAESLPEEKVDALAGEVSASVSNMSEPQLGEERAGDRGPEDRDDEPLFAMVAADAPTAVPNPASAERVDVAPIESAFAKSVAAPAAVTKAALPSRIEQKPMELPVSKTVLPVAPVRRVRVPALAGKTPWVVSKTSAGIAAAVVLMLVLGAWVFRRAPVPAELGSSLEDTHQGVPFADTKNKPMTPVAANAAQPAPAVAKPAEADASGLVPQAAAAVTPTPSVKRASSPKRAPTSARGNEEVVAKDTVTRFATHAAKAQAKPKPKPVKPSSDGIKRYSDLD